MAQAAWHSLVRTIQAKGRMAAMVEFRGPPAQYCVAARATFFIARGLELAGMHIGMAAGAVLGRAAEGDGAGAILHHGLVARQAIHRRVAAQQ